MIGIDVVDIAEVNQVRGAPVLHSEPRWWDRHVTTAETAWILRDASPESAFWLCFAAKEAAYKMGGDRRAVYGDFLAYEYDAGRQVVRDYVQGRELPVLLAERSADNVVLIVGASRDVDWTWQLIAADEETRESTHTALAEHPWMRGIALGYDHCGVKCLCDGLWASVTHMGRYGGFAVARERA